MMGYDLYASYESNELIVDRGWEWSWAVVLETSIVTGSTATNNINTKKYGYSKTKVYGERWSNTEVHYKRYIIGGLDADEAKEIYEGLLKKMMDDSVTFIKIPRHTDVVNKGIILNVRAISYEPEVGLGLYL